MVTIKDRNGMDLIKAEDIKKRWQNTHKNCTEKIFMTQITMMVSPLTQNQTFWKFSVHVLLKPNLKDFEHYLAII